MTRKLIKTRAFIRAMKRLAKSNPGARHEVERVLDGLAQVPIPSSLNAHRLSGKLAGLRACSVAYDLRIVFEIVERGNESVVYLLTVGKHDEVY